MAARVATKIPQVWVCPTEIIWHTGDRVRVTHSEAQAAPRADRQQQGEGAAQGGGWGHAVAAGAAGGAWGQPMTHFHK